MGIQTLDQLEALFRAQGVNTLYIKHLAPNQDNGKNQIYLGKGLDGVLNLFPAEISARSASRSIFKRNSSAGQPKLEAKLKFAWLSGEGGLYPAPHARIIDYFQYPEIRFSGFALGCRNAPDALRRDHQDRYGRRILALGTRPDGVVLGHVLTERDDPLVGAFPKLPEFPAARVLQVLVVGNAGRAPLDLLKLKLREIADAGWHASSILRAGSAAPVPFSGAQGAGYTLEALLGVPANAQKAPDVFGFEIKSFGASRISLMTPTPDGGYQGTHPFRDFMAKYGRPGVKNDGSRRFTGTHRCGVRCARTGLVLAVRGYDPATDSFVDADEVAVDLANPDTGDVVASWSLERLANSWNAKHVSAAYIRYESRRAAAGLTYRYSRSIRVGQGTDVWRLLRAIHTGYVYYDPADTIYADGKPKVRSQWRLDARRLAEAMKTLYSEAAEITV